MGKRGRPRYPDVLTPREQEVLALVREGLTNGEIAERLSVSADTVKTHVSQILSKLGVGTREEAAAWAPEAEGEGWTWRRWVMVGLGTATVVGTVLALGLLAWGVFETESESRDSEAQAEQANVSPTGTASITEEIPNVLRTVPAVSEPGAYLLDLETGELRIVEHPIGAISPDETKMLKPNCCAGGELIVIDIASGHGTLLVDGDIADADWSPDGKQIAYSYNLGGSHGLLVIDAQGGAPRRLTNIAGWGVDWAPSGPYIAFTSAGNDGLSVANAETGEVAEVATGQPSFEWSPDGSMLAYAGDGPLNVYDPVTQESRTIAPGPAWGRLAWSPDGSKIALPYGERIAYGGSQPGDIPLTYIVAVDAATSPVELGPAIRPQWSPDSTEITFVSHPLLTGEWDIYLSDLNGQDRRVTNEPEVVHEGAAWLPDGRTIIYSAHDRVVALDLETGTERILARPTFEIGLHFLGDLSQSGRFITFIAGGGVS